LHRVLQKDPSFFADLISFSYKRDDGKPSPIPEKLDNESVVRRGRVAREVLDSWYLIPGAKDDGSIDENELSNWIVQARKKCANTNHTIGGDIQIGFLLAHAPSDPDGVWPNIAVRNVIERLNNDVIDDHIRNEIFNSRGIVSKAIDDGGKQEHELAENYKKGSDALKAKWPRSAKLLRTLADTYDHQAKSADIDSDLDELRWR
jgi:hypothetical protein